MYHIVYIDKDNYYGKEIAEQNIILLFKKPPHADDKLCETICNEIIPFFKKGDFNTIVSSIFSKLTCYDELDKETLCIFREKDTIKDIDKDTIKDIDTIIPPQLRIQKQRNHNCEIYEGNKLIAKIQKNNPIQRFITLLFLFSIIFGLFYYLYSIHREQERIETNQLYYKNDIQIVDEIRNKFYTATDTSFTYYSDYVYDCKQYINNYLDSIQKVADSNILKVKERGMYTNVIINESLINEVFDNMMVVADKEYKGYIEQNSRNIINDSLVNRDDINKANTPPKEIAPPPKQEKTVQLSPTNSSFTTNTKRNLDLEEVNNRKDDRDINNFNSLIDAANNDYKQFFYNKDESAARRAIRNYKKALTIQSNKDVSFKLELLENSINKE